jgi:hypothetical protein
VTHTQTPETFPCLAGGPAHPAHRDFCQTCEPSATAQEIEACCQDPAPSRAESDWRCRCGAILCAGGHTHKRFTAQECARC